MNKIKAFFSNSRSAINVSFIIILIFVGVLLNIRLRAMMYEFSEDQVARQAGIIAEKSSATFKSVMDSLNSRSHALENQEDEIVQRIMGIFTHTQGAVTLGLMTADGSPAFGEPASVTDFPALREAFRGNGAISYNAEKGLLFCYPVFHGENIKYVLYEIYPVQMLRGRFGVH